MILFDEQKIYLRKMCDKFNCSNLQVTNNCMYKNSFLALIYTPRICYCVTVLWQCIGAHQCKLTTLWQWCYWCYINWQHCDSDFIWHHSQSWQMKVLSVFPNSNTMLPPLIVRFYWKKKHFILKTLHTLGATCIHVGMKCWVASVAVPKSISCRLELLYYLCHQI